jgi:FMN phosphatase YigB (HAD superfamily)
MDAPRGGMNSVFLVDVDNTLLDNDQVTADLRSHMEREFGPERSRKYWAIFEQLRRELGYADYLGALQRYRSEDADAQRLLQMSFFLLDYPFEKRLYEGALDVLRRLEAAGPTVILTDGDVIFQPRKVRRSGIWEAVEGRVLVYVHKEQMLDAIERRFPAEHYVMIDDKLRLLSAVKAQWKERVTTVFVRQGHYALDPSILTRYPPADASVERIGDLLGYPLAELSYTAKRSSTKQ